MTVSPMTVLDLKLQPGFLQHSNREARPGDGGFAIAL